MGAGKLKMWNADRGFGFIKDDAGGPDMFLHISALQSAGIDPDNIRKGDRLTFDVESTREGKTKASQAGARAGGSRHEKKQKNPGPILGGVLAWAARRRELLR
jgi:cold shock protein